jgi:hypothetical protein
MPYLNTETHRLTDLPGEKHPLKCQLCGRTKEDGVWPSRWQEHDHHDKPENRLIVLCRACSDRVIKPHPRLYSERQANQPWPGCMPLCVDCKLRSGVTCTSPDAKTNGGAGVMLTVSKPFSAMVDGSRYCGPMLLWPHPAEACKQKQT